MNAPSLFILLFVYTEIAQTLKSSVYQQHMHSIPDHYQQQPWYISSNIQRVQESFLKDLVTGSVYSRNMNYIFINTDLYTEIQCEYSTCEMYLMTGSSKSELQQLLHNRVETYRHWTVSRYASDTSKEVIITRLSCGYKCTNGRSLLTIIRSYNSKSYIIIITENDFTFQMTKELIFSLKLFNVFVAKQGDDAEMYILYEVCAFCDAGENQLKIYNVWKFGHGFSKEMKYKCSFKGEFWGASLKIGMTLLPPSSFIIGRNADGSPIYSGADYFILQNLERFLNFKAVIKQPEDGHVCSYKDSSGVWILAGYCKMLYMKEIDMAGFPTSLELSDIEYFDPTSVYYITGSTIISHNPTVESSLISSVSPVVLIMIFISYMASAVSFWIITRYYYKVPRTSFVDILFSFFAILNLEATTLHQRGMKTDQMIIMSVWMVVCFIGISVVFGEITSMSASPGSSEKPINSVDDMIQRNASWVTVPGIYMDSYLLSSQDVSVLAKKKSRSDMGITEGLQLVLDKPDEYVYYFARETVDPIIRLLFLNKDGSSPFHISPIVDKEPSTFLTVLVNKDAPYREAITVTLLQIEAAGLVYNKFLPAALDLLARNRIIRTKKKAAAYKSLNLGNMLITFTLIPGILLISCLVCLAECAIYKFKSWIHKSKVKT